MGGGLLDAARSAAAARPSPPFPTTGTCRTDAKAGFPCAQRVRHPPRDRQRVVQAPDWAGPGSKPNQGPPATERERTCKSGSRQHLLIRWLPRKLIGPCRDNYSGQFTRGPDMDRTGHIDRFVQTPALIVTVCDVADPSCQRRDPQVPQNIQCKRRPLSVPRLQVLGFPDRRTNPTRDT